MLWPNHSNVHLGYRRNRAKRSFESIEATFQILPEVFGTRSDRASVIVVVALIDAAMGELLKQAFHKLSDARSDSTKVEKECRSLLDPEKAGMLSGATAKSRMAFVMGLLDYQEFEAIKKLYIVRNEMAHERAQTKITRSQADAVYNSIPQIAKRYVAEVVEAANKYEDRVIAEGVNELWRKRTDATYRFLASCLVYHSAIRAEMQALECYVRKDDPKTPRPRPSRKRENEQKQPRIEQEV